MFSIHICGSHCRHSCTYTVHKKENHVHLEKHAILVHSSGQPLLGFSAVVFLPVGHYPY
jgi:hypothetical protein